MVCWNKMWWKSLKISTLLVTFTVMNLLSYDWLHYVSEWRGQRTAESTTEITHTHSRGAIWFNTLLIWTQTIAVKYLSGFCTSAKTHSLHNVQSMRKQVQALLFFFFLVWLTKSLPGIFFCAPYTGTHVVKLNNLIYTKKDKAVEKKRRLKREQAKAADGYLPKWRSNHLPRWRREGGEL